MPVTNDKTFYFFNETDLTAGVSTTTLQSGKTLEGDPANPNFALVVNEELVRINPDGNPNFGFEINGQLGVSVGDVTADWLETSDVQADQVNPDGQTYTSTVSKKDTFSSSRITYGFDVGPSFRGQVGKAVLDFNPYIGGRFGNYLDGAAAKYPVGTLPGATELSNEGYFVVGARGGVEFGHVGLVASLEHGWGSTGLNVYDADGEEITGQAFSAASQITTFTLGARFTISNPEPVTPISPKEQAESWATGQENEINTKYKDALKANGYDRVEISIYNYPNFTTADTTTPGVPEVSGWYYTIEPIYITKDKIEVSEGAFDSDAGAAGGEIQHTFTTVADLTALLAAYKATVATATDVPATPVVE